MTGNLVLDKKPYALTVIFQLIGILFILIVSGNAAASDKPKRIIKGNMTETYNVLPQNASNIGEVFTEGMIYGRFRTNYFRFFWEEKAMHNPTGFAVGGSLIAKSAPYYGLSATIGGYTSQNLDALDDADAKYGASGKDTFSRFDVLRKNRWGMTVLAQAYLQYSFMKTDVKIGRQICESFLTKSNDTKMIPNTFEGVSLTSRYVPDTSVMLAFFNKQKLRDHTRFHDVITFGHKNRSPYHRWYNNDDSAVHRGLSYANLKAGGGEVNNDLVIVGISNTSITRLKLDAWYNAVPDLFYSFMGEANYKIPIGCGWTLTPGARYMEQFDDGAGKIGGAALSGRLAGREGSYLGYKDADNVDGMLYGARLVLLKGPGLFHLGYTRVSDDADLITPWRGFPTGGYTRSMGQYNWQADTSSFMVKGAFDFGKANLVKGLRASVDWTFMNYDDNKEKLGSVSKTDRYFIHADVWYRLPVKQFIEVKVRMGFVEADNKRSGHNPSYDEYRTELSYLF